MDASSPANQTSVSAQRQLQVAAAGLPAVDQRVDVFSLRGFELMQRIAKCYASSSAVPAIFRLQTEKKQGDGWVVVENPNAIGNCMVAIEVAQAVGMSIAAVMQSADVIEGKLRWSGKFVIAAINASGRFTPLRFQQVSRGRIKAKYREKLGWNREKRGFDFAEREVEVDDVQCIAWALPAGFTIPANIRTLEQARAANLPVIEGAPVSMRMAVEEGWYSKPGSKWQTEMRELMLQYRAGSFFGNIHAPDIVMGMGRTAEEERDLLTVDVAPDGTVLEVRQETVTGSASDVKTVEQVNTTGGDERAPEGVDSGDQQQGNGEGADADAGQDQKKPEPLKFADVADAIVKAGTEIELQAARALIERVDAGQQAELKTKADERQQELAKPAATKPASRRAGATSRNVE